MRRWLMVLLAALAALAPAAALAQAPPESFVGTYDGHQMELAAALRLGDDGRFEYYLSYGALDEMAAGRWSVENDAVVLDGDPVTAPAFVPVDSGEGRAGRFEIALEVPHALPIQLFSAVLILSDGTAQFGDFHEERLRFTLEPGQTAAALKLDFAVFQVSSGRIEVPPGARAMRFRFEPNDLGKVAFAHQVLPQEQGVLLLERYDRVIRFRKQDGDEP